MKTLLDWMLKALTGALFVFTVLAVGGPRVLPISLPLLTVEGRELVLNMSDAAGLVVFVWLAASVLYIIGYGFWRATSFLWSRF
ncbi:MAG: hypothetical protein WBQ78_06555 [Gammaproteobacteria bacterium]